MGEGGGVTIIRDSRVYVFILFILSILSFCLFCLFSQNLADGKCIAYIIQGVQYKNSKIYHSSMDIYNNNTEISRIALRKEYF